MSEKTPADQWKQFLETNPPNTPVEILGLASRAADKSLPRGVVVPDKADIKLPVLELHCDREGGTRTFGPAKDLTFWCHQDYTVIKYTCRNCRKKTKVFALAIQCSREGDVTVMKLGESPPFSTPISPRIPKLLSEPDLDLYRKGVRAMDYGLGIGAASYFRRVVESQWKRLVQEIQKAAKQLGEDVSVYDEALKSAQFTGAVKVLKQAIPDKLLLPGGHNPLTLLHQSLSKQLHGLSDEECLRQAQDIQLVLTALLENIATVLKDHTELRAAVSRLQNPLKPMEQ